jgi:hypothetical protein
MVHAVGGEIFYIGSKSESKETHPKHIQFRVEKDFQNLPNIADSILRYMATAYRLQISMPTALTKPEDWKMEVTRNSGAKDTSLFLRYQPKLFPCTDPKSK